MMMVWVNNYPEREVAILRSGVADACYNSESKQLVHSVLERRGDTIPVQIHEDWYF